MRQSRPRRNPGPVSTFRGRHYVVNAAMTIRDELALSSDWLSATLLTARCEVNRNSSTAANLQSPRIEGVFKLTIPTDWMFAFESHCRPGVSNSTRRHQKSNTGSPRESAIVSGIRDREFI